MTRKRKNKASGKSLKKVKKVEFKEQDVVWVSMKHHPVLWPSVVQKIDGSEVTVYTKSHDALFAHKEKTV